MAQHRKKSTKNKSASSEKAPSEQNGLSETKTSYEKTHFVDSSRQVWNYSLLTDDDVKNFQAGTNYRLYEKFGSHSIQVNDIWGMYFCVWAPNASEVSVIGNFNQWKNHEYK